LHPSYGYEEFFEGYRPAVDASGQMRLRKSAGPLKKLIRTATKLQERSVLILDEMNRGNLARVFGELYFLLEYRDEQVRLMYSPQKTFSLPDDFTILGTMNTADRSVALLDQALRRRFHFVSLFPGAVPVDGMLRRYLKSTYGSSMDWVADMLAAANAKLDRNVAVGPSHFMRRDLDEEKVRRIWNHTVLPTIEEFYFGQDTKLEEFAFDSLCPRTDSDTTTSSD
jgi:5-methylcytosine-specific restriction protein B